MKWPKINKEDYCWIVGGACMAILVIMIFAAYIYDAIKDTIG